MRLTPCVRIVVAITVTGQVPRAERGSDYHKEVNLTKVFEDVCAYQAIIETPEQDHG